MDKLMKYLTMLAVLYFQLPAWARLGGGSSYRSSSSSSSRSYSSSSSGRSWSSGSSSYSSGSSYHGGGGYNGDSSGASVLALIIVLAVFIIIIASMQNAKEPGSGAKDVLRGRGGGISCVAVAVGIVIFLSNPFLVGLLAMAYFAVMNKVTDHADGGRQQLLESLTNLFGQGVGDRLASRLAPNKYNALVQADPNFSIPVFREFAVLLYCQAQQERPEGKFVHSRAFLSPQAANLLAKRSKVDEVSDVVVGACAIESATVFEVNSRITLRLESNYLEKSGGNSRAVIARETWVFERKAGLLTRPPKGVNALSCPSCGYTGDMPANGVCPQCQTTNIRGDFDWAVSNILVESIEQFTPHAAEGGGVEMGTSLPTVTHPDLGRRREDFMTRHPDFSWNEFWNRSTSIFMKLQHAWSQRDPSMCRPFETDVLFRQHRYWIEDYQKRRQINKLSGIDVERWELSNTVTDAYYESITARVFASMIDVTTDESGQLLYGDPKRPRRFTEYWTFIRRVGFKPSKGNSLYSCPSCGATLDNVNQNGICQYCDTVITLGDFDWVLSNIEQDEIYTIDR